MKPFFSKGLLIYTFFLALVFGGYLYLQLNGIQCFSSTKAEHEGQEHTYGSGGHSHGYYHHK